MKKVIVSLLLVSFYAFAGGPSVIITSGGLSLASNPNGRCGGSEYGIKITGTYQDDSGREQQLNGCLNSVSFPLTVTNCNGQESSVIESARALRNLIKSGAISEVKYVSMDSDSPSDNLILLGIECSK
jgi:hypothetical protein